MTFRISTERCAGVPTTVRVAGRLAGDAVDVLMGACVDIGPVVTIDLSEVYYADDAGVQGARGTAGARRGLAEPSAVSRAAAVGPCTWTMRLEERVRPECVREVSMIRR